jgi:hypothetical protein
MRHGGLCLDKLSEMRFFRFVLAAFAAVTLTTFPAAASILWTWDYSAAGINASGTLTTVDAPDMSGGYLITGISGSRNGTDITGLQPAGTAIPGNEPFAVDDLVFLGPGPQLTGNGFGFSLADGNFANPFYADFLPTPGYLEFFSEPPTESSELPVEFSATPVAAPEPASYVLVFGGLAAMVFQASMRRRPS